MAKKDFDDLVKVIKVTNSHSDATVASTEIDLELPRGYIAKIHRVEIKNQLLSGLVTGASEQTLDCALLRDPDDAVTVQIPENSVQHDVICDHAFTGQMDDTDDQSGYSQDIYIYEVIENKDVISARNLRFNSDPENTDPDWDVSCTIFYTLEKVTAEIMLALLDIL